MPVRRRLRNVNARDGRGAREIGNRLRHAQHAREAPRREAQAFARLLSERARLRLQHERARVGLGVQRAALALALAGLRDPRRDGRARFAGWGAG